MGRYWSKTVNENPSSKEIDVLTQRGLDLLKVKAKHYGHYAENLKVLELIAQVENLRNAMQKVVDNCPECMARFCSGVTGSSPSRDS